MQKSAVTPPARHQRINVVGSSGSGKSTFSKGLSAVLDIPHIEMDAVFWGPNWREPKDEAFFLELEKALKHESWILDGNYTRTIPIKWRKAQAVIWLDYAFPITIFQAIKRATKRAYTREEIWPGTNNRESFKKSFLSRDSIILWSFTSYHKVKAKYKALAASEAYGHIDFIRLKTPQDAKTYLEGLGGGGTAEGEENRGLRG